MKAEPKDFTEKNKRISLLSHAKREVEEKQVLNLSWKPMCSGCSDESSKKELHRAWVVKADFVSGPSKLSL